MKEQKKHFMYKLSLNKRLALVTVLILVPMIALVSYLLYLLNNTNQAFGDITESGNPHAADLEFSGQKSKGN